MATSAKLSGLIKWTHRGDWQEIWEDVFWAHIASGCEAFDIGPEDLPKLLSDQSFAMLWGCAFEDFLSRSRDSDGRTPVTDYLKRRGWNEPVPNKRYMEALGTSLMSLYEVSDIVPGESFLARDLIRGGDPVRVSERTATRMLQPWDKLGARIVEHSGKTVMGGGVLMFDSETANRVQGALETTLKRTGKEIRKIAKRAGEPLPEASEREAAALIVLMNSAPVFSGAWLNHALSRILDPKRPGLANHDGDEIVFCKTVYPWVPRTGLEAIRDRLRQVPEFVEASDVFWNWVGKTPAGSAGSVPPTGMADDAVTTAYSSWLDTGELVLGNIEILERTVVLTTNSRARAERGAAIVAACLGDLVRAPLTEIQTVDQAMANSSGQPPEPTGLAPEEEAKILRDSLDAHYRETLDHPLGMLNGVSPRAAARTAKGREKVVGWLKYLENQSRHNPDAAMAAYDFTWMWAELGLLERRQ